MIESVDRILVAVRDAAKASETCDALLGARPRSESRSRVLGARRFTLALGASEIELLQPEGNGLVSAFLDRWGEGLFAAGLASRDLPGLLARLRERGIRFAEESGQAHLGPEETRGLRITLSAFEAREGEGPVRHLYEVTNMVSDWRAAAERYADLFALEPARFHPISSALYGYAGSLLLFDPPARLDRIELAEVTDPSGAMGRFVRRRGESLYMCFVEADDPQTIVSRLEERGARWTPAQDYGGGHLFVHPASLHGVLMGISRTNAAWAWSGRPELAPVINK